MDQNGVRPPKVVTHHLAMTFRQRNKVFFICNIISYLEFKFPELHCATVRLSNCINIQRQPTYLPIFSSFSTCYCTGGLIYSFLFQLLQSVNCRNNDKLFMILSRKFAIEF